MQDPYAPNPAAPPPPPPLPAAGPLPPPMPPALHGFYQGGVREDERTLAMLCHLLGILTGFIGPLILWLVKKDSSPFVDHHGREALNFQITMLLVSAGLAMMMVVLMFVVIGFALIPLLMLLPVVVIVMEVIAAVAAQRGDWYRYPFTLRLL